MTTDLKLDSVYIAPAGSIAHNSRRVRVGYITAVEASDVIFGCSAQRFQGRSSLNIFRPPALAGIRHPSSAANKCRSLGMTRISALPDATVRNMGVDGLQHIFEMSWLHTHDAKAFRAERSKYCRRDVSKPMNSFSSFSVNCRHWQQLGIERVSVEIGSRPFPLIFRSYTRT